MDLDVEEASVLPYPDRRCPCHGRQDLAFIDDAKPAWPLGDEKTAIGQEREAPRRFQIPGNDLEFDRLLLGLDDRALWIDFGLGFSLVSC